MRDDFNPRMTKSVDYPPMTLIGRCQKCKAGLRVEAQPGAVRRTWQPAFLIGEEIYVARFGSCGDGVVLECKCGSRMLLKPFHGKFVEGKKCDMRCMNATGNNCECQCGGKNHGATWSR